MSARRPTDERQRSIVWDAPAPTPERDAPSILDTLSDLRAAGAIDDLDVEFARFVASAGGGVTDSVVLAAVVASRAGAEGHVCVDLGASVEGDPVWREVEGSPVAPALATWRDALRSSPVVAEPGGFAPLVLDGADRLYLHRAWDHERRLAESIRERSAPIGSPDVDLAALRESIDAVFPDPPDGVDWQRVAAAVAALRRVCLVSGGPGTGKTTTVVRILEVLRRIAEREPRIALAAPTGKAAARLQEAIEGSSGGSETAPRPERARTLHALLGLRRGSAIPRYRRDAPLPFDVVVVDEASMVDLALMAKLFDALSDRARLVLLGDRDQLASVEAGAVLGDLCRDADGFGAELRGRLERACGTRLPEEAAGPSVARDSVVLLRRNWRFDERSGIGRLASAVRDGDADAAWATLRDPAYPDVAALDPSDEETLARALADRLERGYARYLDAIRKAREPDEALAAFDAFRILCAVRDGARGVAGVVAAAERTRRPGRARAAGARESWYPGRPILVTRNDYTLDLRNGDVGVVVRADGGLRVAFRSRDGVRLLAPARLSDHETVWAMTIHKSQGSEFDEALVVLPDAGSRALSRELLYTGVTRARSRVEILGSEDAIREATVSRVKRASGLPAALREVRDGPSTDPSAPARPDA